MMAQVLKDRARKPLLQRAAPLAAQSHVDGQLVYRIDFYAPHPDRGYSIILTRVEMLKAVSSWMAGEARAADDEEKCSQRSRSSSSSDKP